MELSDVGKLLILAGVGLAVVGLALVLGGRVGLGRLPGDLRFEVGGLKVYVPLATSILLSVVATVLLNLLLRR